MKYIFFSLGTLFFCNYTVGQSQEKTLLNIVYEFKHIRDTDNKSNPIKINMVLSLGAQNSRFVKESVFKSNSKAALAERKKRKEMAEAAMASSSTVMVAGQPVLNISNAGAMVDEEIFIDRQQNKLTNSGRIGFKNYYYTTNIPQLKFDLKPERKKILGYNCQKATTDYGGRIYELWFTTALPYSFGPWKLQGLPGVILEAADSKNEVSFIATDISKNTDPDEVMIPYMDEEDGIKVKEKEYKQTAERFVEDPETIAAAQFPNARITIRNTENPENKNITKVKKYNPIELQ